VQKCMVQTSLFLLTGLRIGVRVDEVARL